MTLGLNIVTGIFIVTYIRYEADAVQVIVQHRVVKCNDLVE